MKGELIIKINKKLHTFTDFSDIPSKIGAVISFMPEYPEPPHTEEQHEYIETFNDKLKQLMERECQQLRG